MSLLRDDDDATFVTPCTYSFKCSVAKTRLTLVSKLYLSLLLHSTKTPSFSSLQNCTYQLHTYSRKQINSTMLHVNSCINIKHNSESIFCHFASASKQQLEYKMQQKRSSCYLQLFEDLQKVGYVPLYTICKLIVGIWRLGF